MFLCLFQITFGYKTSYTNPGESFIWKDPGQETSYYLCDQTWHTVKVMKTGQSISIIVDKILAYGGGLTNAYNNRAIRGQNYIGGLKGG